MNALTIELTDEEYERVKDRPERVVQFLRYSPGSPIKLAPPRGFGMPLAFGDAANC